MFTFVPISCIVGFCTLAFTKILISILAEYSVRQTRRQSNKQSYISDTISTSNSSNQRQTTNNLDKKSSESKVAYRKVGTQATSYSKACILPSVNTSVNAKFSNMERSR